jgi:hypothetical protein
VSPPAAQVSLLDWRPPEVKPTSWRCLQQIEAEGLLSEMRLLVYRELIRRGPVTGRELDAALARPGETRTSYHKRLSELERAGLARVALVRPCQVTGREAEAWEAVDALPLEVAGRTTRVEAFAAELAAFFEDNQQTWTGPEVAHRIRQLLRGD